MHCYLRKRIGASSCCVLLQLFDLGNVDLSSLKATFLLLYLDILSFKGVKLLKLTQIEVKGMEAYMDLQLSSCYGIID